MKANIAACGIYNCQDCRYLESESCPGCAEGNRALQDVGDQLCAVFTCVESRGLTSCAECSEESCVLKRSVETICPMRSRFENTRWWAGRMARALEPRKHAGEEADAAVKMSGRVVNRLRLYLTALDAFAEEGATSVSSWRLAQKVGVNAALIRKDLSRFGEFGTPSLGYRIDYLSRRISEILGLGERKGIVWLGAACFRLHFPSVGKLSRHACGVVAIFDNNPEEIGSRVGDLEVLPLESIAQTLSELRVSTAVLALPGPDAAKVAETLVEHGTQAILNLSGEMLALPDSVKVCSFDVMGELLELCYYCQ
jgi:redox-sensing transcriptional repressor